MALGVVACKRPESTGEAAAAPSGSTPTAVASAIASAQGVALPLEVIARQVNRGGLPPYDGPTGKVRGRITVTGDPPPVVAGTLPPAARCGTEARDTYEKLFRVGRGGELADAFIGVTDYKAFVPATEPVVQLTIRGCAFDRRTVALTYGQRIEVKNLDPSERYLPHLDKAQAPVLRMAMPGGDAVPLLPPLPGPYTLVDDLLHPWMNADVLVLKFATGAVSDTQGSFTIDRVPVGSVKVSAMHPHIRQSLERTVTIEAGKTTEVNFELTYSKSEAAPPAAPPSGSAAKPTAPPVKG